LDDFLRFTPGFRLAAFPATAFRLAVFFFPDFFRLLIRKKCPDFG
jgi:hypothetical protein